MFRSCNFKNREVVNIDTAEKIGIVNDVEIDEATGNIKTLIVKKRGVIFSFLWNGEMSIPWSSIVVMGRELILVKITDYN